MFAALLPSETILATPHVSFNFTLAELGTELTSPSRIQVEAISDVFSALESSIRLKFAPVDGK